MLAFDSDEEKMLTGTETRPKEIVAVPIDRAGMTVGLERKALSLAERRYVTNISWADKSDNLLLLTDTNGRKW